MNLEQEIIEKVGKHFEITTDRKKLVVLKCSQNELREVKNLFLAELWVRELSAFNNLKGFFTVVLVCENIPSDFPVDLARKLLDVSSGLSFIDKHALGFAENGVFTISTINNEQSLKLMRCFAGFLGTSIKSIKAKMFDDNSCAFKVRFIGTHWTTEIVIEKFRLEELLWPK